jgi:NhaP-type Na+/H+ or K+/H+ antiporter
LLFGAVAVPVVLDRVDWWMVGYAVLSLTVVRMVPVALALLGTGLPPPTVAFIGWFGPRGLASVVFALIAVEELQVGADRAVAVIGLTVLLSVFAHGLSAQPLARRYGGAVADTTPAPPGGEPPRQLPVRGLVARDPAGETERPSVGDAR